MKLLSLAFLAASLCVGCVTPQTTEQRKQERAPAYHALTPEEKNAVDHGQLRHGMNTNAVYLSWGAPSEVLRKDGSTIWIYREKGWREEKTTTWRSVPSSSSFSSVSTFPEETRTLYPDERIRAQVYFENGKVKEWRLRGTPVGF